MAGAFGLFSVVMDIVGQWLLRLWSASCMCQSPFAHSDVPSELGSQTLRLQY